MRLILLLACFMVVSCSTVSAPPSEPTNVSWEKRSSSLTHLTRWSLNGKIAVQSAQNSGSATIDWSQNQQNFNISLTGPMGAGGLKLSGHPGKVTLQSGDGQYATATSPEQLLAKQWGWHLPVSNLRYWVRGLPVPGVAANPQYDQYHRLTSLTQQGWNVQYLGYTQSGGVELPHRIHISSPSLKAKMVIYAWNTRS